MIIDNYSEQYPTTLVEFTETCGKVTPSTKSGALPLRIHQAADILFILQWACVWEQWRDTSFFLTFSAIYKLWSLNYTFRKMSIILCAFFSRIARPFKTWLNVRLWTADACARPGGATTARTTTPRECALVESLDLFATWEQKTYQGNLTIIFRVLKPFYSRTTPPKMRPKTVVFSQRNFFTNCVFTEK
jgi:hypothetical protein